MAEKDVYRCPAGHHLPRHMTTIEDGMAMHRYWDRASCASCSLKPRCTPSKERRIRRWEHEQVIEAMQERMDRAPNVMRVRRATVEHPFGTMKAWVGATHFRLKTLKEVKTEMSLHVLAYNLNRAIQIIGVGPLMQAMQA